MSSSTNDEIKGFLSGSSSAPGSRSRMNSVTRSLINCCRAGEIRISRSLMPAFRGKCLRHIRLNQPLLKPAGLMSLSAQFTYAISSKYSQTLPLRGVRGRSNFLTGPLSPICMGRSVSAFKAANSRLTLVSDSAIRQKSPFSVVNDRF